MRVEHIGAVPLGIVARLLEPDRHDPACPFAKHCYCDDGASHDTVTHPLAQEAAATIESLAEVTELLAGFAEKASTLDFNEDRNVMWAVIVAAKARDVLSRAAA